MKKIFTILSVGLLLSSYVQAQVHTVTTSGTITKTTAAGTTTSTYNRKQIIDSNTVVKDSAGVCYAYKDWHSKIINGGYSLKVLGLPTDSISEFVLIKMDADAIARFKSFRPPSDESGIIKTGEKLDLFKTKDINGNKIDPKELAGKIVILNFWFIDCAPCRMEMPELNKIKDTYANDPGIVFIAIALDEKYKVKDFLKNSPFNYTIVPDGKTYASMYGIRGYPTNIVIGKDGNIAFHLTGYGPEYPIWIKEAIEKAKK